MPPKLSPTRRPARARLFLLLSLCVLFVLSSSGRSPVSVAGGAEGAAPAAQAPEADPEANKPH